MSQTMLPKANSRKSSARPPTPNYDDLASAEDRAFQKVQAARKANPNATRMEMLAAIFPQH